MRRTYQIPSPKLPFALSGEQQSFRFPVREIQPVRSLERRSQPEIRIDNGVAGGVLAAPSFVFPVNQPLIRRTYRVASRFQARSASLTPAASSLPPWTELLQPDLRRRALVDELRYRADLVEQVHFGGTVVNIDYLQAVKLDFERTPKRLIPGTNLPILGVTAVTDTQVFGVSVMPTGYTSRTPIKVFIRQISGPSAEIPVVPNALAAFIQPDRWTKRRTDYRIVAAPQRLDGATIQQLFIYPLSQPERKQWYGPRAQPVQALRVEGTPNLQRDLFTFRQPFIKHERQYPPNEKQLLGVFTPPAAQQSYVFYPNQPERRAYYVPRLGLWIVGFAPRFEGTAPTVPQLHPMPTILGPDRSYWTKTRFGAQVRSIYTPLETLAPITPGDTHEFVLYVVQEWQEDFRIFQGANGVFYIVQGDNFETER